MWHGHGQEFEGRRTGWPSECFVPQREVFFERGLVFRLMAAAQGRLPSPTPVKGFRARISESRQRQPVSMEEFRRGEPLRLALEAGTRGCLGRQNLCAKSFPAKTLLKRSARIRR